MPATLRDDGTLVVREAHALTDVQVEFCRKANTESVEEVLFDGSIRAGKTQAACRLIAAWAWHYGGPNWKFAILRKTYRELADSTQAAFYKGDGKMPPACPPELVKRYLAKDETVILKNGAQIIFRSAENPRDTEDKIRNVTLAGFFIDQVEEFEDDAYFHLYETLLSRMSDPRGPQKALLVANPGPEDHWVHRRFVNPDSKEPQCERVHVTLFDNEKNLDPRYVKRMKRRSETNPLFYRRFILGEWGAFGGKRFPTWNVQQHVIEPFAVHPDWEIVQAIDYGWANPTASIWCALDFEGHWYVVAEHYEREKPISYHARRMKEIENELNISPSAIFLDPSAWAKRSEYESSAAEFADYGISAGRAQNDRLGGWNRIEEMLTDTVKSDERPQLQVFSTCTNLIREIGSARIKEGTDDIHKENDHALDALRYAIMSRMPTPLPHDEEEEDPTTKEAVAKRIIEKATSQSAETLRMS